MRVKMPKDSSKAAVNPSKEGTSQSVKPALGPQLSPEDGVQSDVSSMAMDRGLLAIAGEAQGVDSDAAVMLRVKQGDDSAFDYLVQKYRRAMLSFMFRMAHNSAAAEDLAQEVFLRVYRSRESYEPSAKFTTWLYRIATNLAVNHAREIGEAAHLGGPLLVAVHSGVSGRTGNDPVRKIVLGHTVKNRHGRLSNPIEVFDL